MINEHGLEILENQNTPGVGRRKGGEGLPNYIYNF
jgi:hypothetical protein